MYFEVSPNIRLYYEKEGQGDDFILLHGNGEDMSIFNDLRAKLKAHFTLYLIDSRSHGKSTDAKELHYQDMADDVTQFIHKLHLKRPHLLGFSDGAIISLMIAMKHPQLLMSLIACGPNLNPKGLKKVFQKILNETPVKDKYLHLMATEPTIRFKSLETIQIPVLLTSGEHDAIYKRHLKAISCHIPDCEHLSFKDHDHQSYIVHSDFLYPKIQAFIRKKSL